MLAKWPTVSAGAQKGALGGAVVVEVVGGVQLSASVAPMAR